VAVHYRHAPHIWLGMNRAWHDIHGHPPCSSQLVTHDHVILTQASCLRTRKSIYGARQGVQHALNTQCRPQKQTSALSKAAELEQPVLSSRRDKHRVPVCVEGSASMSIGERNTRQRRTPHPPPRPRPKKPLMPTNAALAGRLCTCISSMVTLPKEDNCKCPSYRTTGCRRALRRTCSRARGSGLGDYPASQGMAKRRYWTNSAQSIPRAY
jgi:hypothetical protein